MLQHYNTLSNNSHKIHFFDAIPMVEYIKVMQERVNKYSAFRIADCHDADFRALFQSSFIPA